MHVTVQHHHIARSSQKRPRRPCAVFQLPTVNRRRAPQCFEPLCQRHQHRRRCRAWCMQTGQHRAEDASGFVIPATCDLLCKRCRALRAHHQQRFVIVSQHGRRTLACPPGHQLVTGPLFRRLGDFQHGGRVALAYGEKIAVQRNERFPIDGQPPSFQVLLKHGCYYSLMPNDCSLPKHCSTDRTTCRAQDAIPRGRGPIAWAYRGSSRTPHGNWPLVPMHDNALSSIGSDESRHAW